MVGTQRRSRSTGSPRRRRPLLPLGLRVFSLDCLGLVAVFLVGYRSSSVSSVLRWGRTAQPRTFVVAGPSLGRGSRSLRRRPGRRARSHSVVVVCGRVPAAAAVAAAAPRSRGRPFRRCGSSTAFFVCVRDFCAALWSLVGAVALALTQAVLFLSARFHRRQRVWVFQRLNSCSDLRISRRGGAVCPCVRAATTLLSHLDALIDGFFRTFVPSSRPDE